MSTQPQDDEDMSQQNQTDEGSDESVEVAVNVADESSAAEQEEATEAQDSEAVDTEAVDTEAVDTEGDSEVEESSEEIDASEGGEPSDASVSADASEVSDVDEEEAGAPGQPAGDADPDVEDLFLSVDDQDVEVVEETGLAPSELKANADELAERVEELEETVADLEQERDTFKERMLRKAADLDNFRKRAKKERKELEKYGSKRLVADVLPIIDNLERAVEHAQENAEGNILEGVEMVVRQLHTTLNKHGVEVFDAVGEEFNPEHHEAIQQVQTSEHESGIVMEQFQRGYLIHDRLLRPALVAVSKYVEPEEDDEEASDAEEVEEEVEAVGSEESGGTEEPSADGDGGDDSEA